MKPRCRGGRQSMKNRPGHGPERFLSPCEDRLWSALGLLFRLLRLFGFLLRHHYLDGLLGLLRHGFRSLDDALGDGLLLRFLGHCISFSGWMSSPSSRIFSRSSSTSRARLLSPSWAGPLSFSSPPSSLISWRLSSQPSW